MGAVFQVGNLLYGSHAAAPLGLMKILTNSYCFASRILSNSLEFSRILANFSRFLSRSIFKTRKNSTLAMQQHGHRKAKS